MYKDIGTLLYIEEVPNNKGIPIKTTIEYEVFLSKKSIARSEFYLGNQAGMNPTIAFETRVDDFEQTKHIKNGKPLYAQQIEFEDCIYNIIRTYQKNDELIELVCGV